MAGYDAVVVGAGVAGLSCALRLVLEGRSVVVLEASDGVGGRVRSDVVDGFVLDRGFQVLLTAYPSCQKILDYPSLALGEFEPGALVYINDRNWLVGDPVRSPHELMDTVRAPVGGLFDKVRMLRLRQSLSGRPLDQAWKSDNKSTLQFLRARGFSSRMIERFFRPFMSGIFLERELATSARLFSFVFQCFAQGSAALPAGGMQKIPDQMAAAVGHSRIRLNTPVASVYAGGVKTMEGEEVPARHVVVAVDQDQARRWIPGLPSRGWNSGTTYYFSAAASPLRGAKKLWFNGSGHGKINHIAVPSDIAPGYAPAGKSLVCVNTVGDAAMPLPPATIMGELTSIFGEEARRWLHLRTYAIEHALPSYGIHEAAQFPAGLLLPEGVRMCGDAGSAGSLEMAMHSGLAAAEGCLAA